MLLQRKVLYGVVALAAATVVLGAAGLYLKLSARGEAAPTLGGTALPGSASAAPQDAVPAAAAPSIEVAAERLAQRLKDNDGTGDDWALLARSYVHLKRYPEAIDAFAEALQKMPGNQAFLNEQAAARKAAVEPPVR
jgi:cytochrome c-type biogenesis protein CcmH/NrfG